MFGLHLTYPCTRVLCECAQVKSLPSPALVRLTALYLSQHTYLIPLYPESYAHHVFGGAQLYVCMLASAVTCVPSLCVDAAPHAATVLYLW